MDGKRNNETVLDAEKENFIKATIRMHISRDKRR